MMMMMMMGLLEIAGFDILHVCTLLWNQRSKMKEDKCSRVLFGEMMGTILAAFDIN